MSKKIGKTLARERRDETISSLPVAYTGRGGSKKGSGGSSAGTMPDTLFSTSTVRIVGIVGEGEIGGVVDGLKGVYRNDVPIQNQDGTFNFKGITCDFRTGTPDQPYMAGYPDVETARNVGVKVNQATPVVASVSDENVDRVRVTLFIPALFIQKNDGTYQANTVNYKIAARWYNGQYTTLGEFSVTGKTTSGYYRQHEVVLPRNTAGASAPWAVQVTRLSPDTDGFNNSQSKYTVQSDLIFYSITEIIDSKLTYPWSALVGMTAQTSQLGDDLGEFRTLVDGIKMMVPSNRDQANRTYNGFWDGTFKEETADSPPWALYLLMENDRFGLGEFLDQAGIDKVTLYEIGRYCDTLVDDGAGGREPRYTINAEITSQEEAYDLLQLVAQIYHGMVYWSSGAVTSTWDAPRDAKFLATESNVIDGLFTYSSSARKARHTAAIVKWHDPKNLYRENIEFVELGEAIARYGYNPITIDLLGCTSRGQAHRHGLWTLLTETYETQVVKFQGGLEYALARPGDVVSVQDPQISNLDYGGRLLAGSTASSLRLDRAVTLKDGVEFVIEVTNPDGSVSERGISGVTTDARGRAVVALTNPLEFIPDPAVVWQISGDIVPQLFRIVTITESQPHIYDVTGLQYEPTKYDAVDNGAPLIPEPISEFPNIVLPPTNLAVRESQYMSNGSARESLTLSWTPGQAFNSIGYYVTIVRPTGEVVNSPRTASTSVDILDAGPGDYHFIVVAIGLNGRTSLPAEIKYTASGWAGVTAPSVVGLQVKGGGSTFWGRSCTMEWNRAFPGGQSPYDTQCVAYVFDISTNALLHREVLPAGVNEFTYDYNINVNEGGPRRSFRVAVSAVTPDGREGAPASLVVSNPPPAKVTPKLTWTTESVVVQTNKPDDPDFVGFLIWMSETQGFNPTDANVTVDTLSSSEFIKASPGTTYYVRVAAYDAFAKNLSGLNLSDEFSVSTNIFPIDTTGPDQPTGLVLTTESEVSASGVVTSSITATWNPVGSKNLAQYEFELAEGDGTAPLTSWMRNPTDKGVNTYTWRGVRPGRLFAARVRGVNAAGYWGAYSSIVTIVSAKNTSKPGQITNFTIDASYRAAVLKWNNPPDLDLDYVEVWEGSDTTQNSLLNKVAAPAAFYFDNDLATLATRTYWLRPVNTSGTVGDFVGPKSTTLPQLQAAAIAAGIIDATKIAASLSVPTNGDTLPGSGIEGKSLAVLNGELYRYVGGKWTKEVKAPDITGFVTSAQIQTLDAAKVAGQLTNEQLASIDAAKLVGQVVNDQIATLDAAKIAGQLADSQINGIAAAKIAGQLTSAQIASLDALKISGQIRDTQLADNAITQAKLAANLSAVGIVDALPNPSGYTGSKVVLYNGKLWRLVDGAWTAGVGAADITGQVTAGQIASLNAAQIAGQISNSQIAAIDGAKVTGSIVNATLATTQLTGTIAEAQIANGAVSDAKIAALAASKVTGTLTASQIASVNAAVVAGQLANATIAATALTGTITSSQIQSLAATQLTGQITGTQITDSSVSTAKIAAGAVVAGSIAARAVVASKLAIVSQNIAFNSDASQGTQGFTAGGTMPSGGAPYVDSSWTPTGMLAIGITAQATAATINGTANAYWDLRTRMVDSAGNQSDYPAAPGVTYEFSAAISSHRSTGRVYVLWLNSSGEVISSVDNANRVTNQSANSGTPYALWPKTALIATAPSGTVRMGVGFRMDAVTGDGPYLFVSAIMIAATVAGATETSPYIEPGVTVIDGSNIVTGSLHANRITASTITGDRIAGRTISASNLVAGTITAGEIAAGTITSAQIAAGTIQAGNIAAGAVTAGKLTIAGINMANDPTFSQAVVNTDNPFVPGYSWGAGFTIDAPRVRTDFCPSGLRAISVRIGSRPTSGVLDIYCGSHDAAGNFTHGYPVVPNQWYEFSCYFSVLYQGLGQLITQFFDSAGNLLDTAYSGNVGALLNGTDEKTWEALGGRARVMRQAPPGATRVHVTLRWNPPNPNNGEAYFFVSGMMFAPVSAAQAAANEFSPFSPGGVTILNGNTIRTETIYGDRLVARTITAGQVAVGTLTASEIAAGTITGDRIAANTIVAANIQAGAITTREIAAGAVTTNKLTVMNREINIVGLTPRYISASNLIQWDSGTIYYRADDGSMVGINIAAGQFQPSGNDWYSLLWYKGRSYLDYNTDVNYGSYDSNWVTIATYDNGGRTLAVNYGPTLIDGNAIVTGSVKAQQIAAGTITGDRISGGTITGSLLQGGTIQGNHIAGRTISAGNLVAGTITTNEIAVRTIKGDNIVGGTITGYEVAARTINAGNLVAGTITAGEIAAGAIVTSKLAITTGNIAYNGDLSVGDTRGFSAGNNNWNGAAIDLSIETTRVASGMRGLRAVSSGGAGSGSFFDVIHQRSDAAGNLSGFPCNGGQLYEISCYYTCHRCLFEMYLVFRDSNSNWLSTPGFYHSGQGVVKSGGAMKDYPRAQVIATAPSNATNFIVLLRGGNVSGDSPYIFPFGFMYAAAAPGTAEASPYVPPSVTNISGTQITTNSIQADRIVTRSITAAQINGGTITAYEIAGATITGNLIAGNTITGSNINAGTIGAREIAANSITTTKLTIANREINLVGFNFRYVAATRRIEWDSGEIYYRDDNGGISGRNIPGGSFDTGGNYYTLLWYKGNSKLDWNPDFNYGTVDTNFVTLGLYSGGSQFYVNYGSTLLDGDRIITNSLHANKIIAGSITADKIAGNTITGANIVGGSIGADQIAAGAVVADKIGVGLNSTNQVWNSDFTAGSGGNVPNVVGFAAQSGSDVYCGINQSGSSWEPPGMRSLVLSAKGVPDSGRIADIYLGLPQVTGGYTRRFPVLANRKYEISAYVSAHRSRALVVLTWFDGSGNQIYGFEATNTIENQASSGPLAGWARCTGMHITPSNAAYVEITLRMGFNGGDSPYNFWTGIYFAPAKANQTQYSDWAPGSYTVISGGAISARTITAEQISVRSLTADLLSAGTITGYEIAGNTITGNHIQANSIYADKIQIGGGQSLTTWMGGANNTQINGGMISANSISANMLKIGMRGVNVVGLNIRYIVATRRIEWDAGSIFYTADDGSTKGQDISAGGFTVSGNNWYSILWPFGVGSLASNTDINFDKNNPNHLCIATYDNGTGLSVNYGSTIIDGARIVTNSITATQIAARTIQASQIAAGTITGAEIAGGSVTADKITGGTITAGSLIQMGDGRMRFECNAGVPRQVITDGNNLRVLIGNVEGFSPNGGTWGVVVWDNANNVLLAPSGLNGGGIWARSIGADKIAANTITANELSTGTLITQEAQIGQATIGTLRLQGGAVSQLVASSNPNGQSTSVTLYVRAGARVRISGQRTGAPGVQFQAGVNTGAIKLRRDGNDIFATVANFMFRYDNQANVQASYKYLLGHYVSVTDNPPEGNHTYEVVDDNGAGVNGVYIEVTELAR